ncbi:MAG: di-heme oxidoredictase family protein [Pseudomonadota bacterium]
MAVTWKLIGLAAATSGAVTGGVIGLHAPSTTVPDYSAVAGDPHLDVIARTAAEAERIAAVRAAPTDFDAPQRFEARPGGAATNMKIADENAFSIASANIAFERELDFKVGNGLFKKLWVSSPASTLASDGLGPLYNARSCQRCHLKDGRGHPPEAPDDTAVSLVVRAAIPGDGPAPRDIEGYLPARGDPVYGQQISDFSIAGIPAEAGIAVEWEEHSVVLSDGEVAHLRRPRWRLTDLGYGPLHPDTVISPRVAPQMIGLGLLEAIPAEDILALADPGDADGDGISGRPHIVWSAEYERPMLGRFGVKATAPTLRQQAADAFANDIGISTTVRRMPAGECTAAQTACLQAPDGRTVAHDGEEVSDVALQLVTFYTQNLAVPVRRDVDDPEVLRGKAVFHANGCAACHTPSFVTHRLADRPEQSFQLIWPYTDLLLHDMGPGLADGMPAGVASGREWRTPPLWGIGLTPRVNGHSYYLHDGRARSLLEAVLWHGGEAQAARDRVVEMPKADRDALIRFIGSL